MLIPDAGWFWDHAEQRNKIAQDYLFVNYVCTSGKHYPLEFRLFRKQEVCEALKEPFRNHTELCCELIDWVVRAADPRRLRLRLLLHQRRDAQPHPREKDGAAYVGDLKTNRKLEWKGRTSRRANWRRDPGPDRKEMRIGDGRQWYFTATVRIPDVKHKVRIVILWHDRMGGAAEQGPGDEPDHLGGASDRAGVPASLDGHGDLPSGRQAATRAGRLSAA